MLLFASAVIFFTACRDDSSTRSSSPVEQVPSAAVKHGNDSSVMDSSSGEIGGNELVNKKDEQADTI